MVGVLAAANRADAQGWSGFYVGGSAGGGFQGDKADETVRFDTNLDGAFGDTIRTVAGADAFSPGFCGGLAGGTDLQRSEKFDFQVIRLSLSYRF